MLREIGFFENKLMKYKKFYSTILAASLLMSGTIAQEISRDASPAREIKKMPDVIFVPTPQEAVEKMLEMAEISNSATLPPRRGEEVSTNER